MKKSTSERRAISSRWAWQACTARLSGNEPNTRPMAGGLMRSRKGLAQPQEKRAWKTA
jgi:hypothetical protein